MSFSYGVNFNIDVVRDLCQDINPLAPNLSDETINRMYTVQQSTFQSSMFFSGNQGRQLPYQPMSYLRVAALCLDCMAALKAQLASIKALPDVKLDASDSAKMLMAKADSYRKVDDESGAFVILEQVSTVWGMRDRYWSQIQRQTAGGYYP